VCHRFIQGHGFITTKEFGFSLFDNGDRSIWILQAIVCDGGRTVVGDRVGKELPLKPPTLLNMRTKSYAHAYKIV